MSPRNAEPAPASSVPTAARLDGIEWAATLSALAFGVAVRVRINDAALADDIARLLPPGWQRVEPDASVRVYSVVKEANDRSGAARGSIYVDDVILVQRVLLPRLLRVLESHVQIYVAEMAPDRVFVHAGVVGHRGRAILVPGRSFSGKTTLVAALVRAGADYYSDEYAVLDAAGRVHPYPRPLAMRQAGVPGITKCDAASLGGRVGHDPLAVGLVIVCKFQEAATWNPETLSPGHGIQALFANTVSARRIPETVLATLHRVVSAATVVSSDRGQAENVVGAIFDLALWG